MKESKQKCLQYSTFKNFLKNENNFVKYLTYFFFFHILK